jgi:Putative transposase/Transposase zinc-binding domain
LPLTMAGVYVPRSPTTGVLYGVVQTHWNDFAATVRERTDGVGLPSFVVAEFRKFLRCGVLAHGFARIRCGDCAFERLLPFSCKGRGFCPSCGGRRMTERAAHLVEHVFPPDVPVRQWVLSVPHRLRYRLAYDHRLCRIVLGVFVRALRSAYRRQAKRQGLASGETGMVTSVQRFGGSLNLHVHFHTLVLDGIFVADTDGLRFHPAPAPTDDDVRRVVRRVRRRLVRLGIGEVAGTDGDVDPLAEESEALAGLSRAAILGRTALGGRAGRGPLRIGADPDASWVDRDVPLHAHDGGFDLHAAVHVGASDRGRLAELCRYLCRPPFAQHRLRKLIDGRIAIALQRPWADGTTHLVFTPMEVLERLVPLVPRPRINLLIYHGVLAPNAPWRRLVVAREEESHVAGSAVAAAPSPATSDEIPSTDGRRTPIRPRYRSWAELMRRAFDTDVLACPKCGGRMVLLATIEDPVVISRILTHLGLSHENGDPLPEHGPP